MVTLIFSYKPKYFHFFIIKTIIFMLKYNNLLLVILDSYTSQSS